MAIYTSESELPVSFDRRAAKRSESYLYNWLARPVSGGTLTTMKSEDGSDMTISQPADPSLDLRECGSGVGVVML